MIVHHICCVSSQHSSHFPSHFRHVGAPQQPRPAAVDPVFPGRAPRLARGPELRGAAQKRHAAADVADAGGELQGGDETDLVT